LPDMSGKSTLANHSAITTAATAKNADFERVEVGFSSASARQGPKTYCRAR
jgi:hypothetical protein